MQFSIRNTDTVIVSHLGAELPFNVGELKKSKLNVPGKDLFLEINQYLNELDHHTQFAIFNIYKELRELRDEVISVPFNTQQKETTVMMTQLYELLDIERLAKFAARANIIYPEGLFSRSSEQALTSNVNININYYKEDYDGIVVLVLALRPMIPVWGEYISLHKNSTGTHYKEYKALKLISKTSLNNSPYMDRLRLYINEWRTTGNSRGTLADDIAVLDGISSDDLTDYILGLILVRRLSLCNIHANTEKESIISSVYSYLKSKLTEAANTFKTKKKYDDGAGRESGEEVSILEKYKISSKLTHGDREFLKEYARLPVNIAKEIDVDLDMFVLDECLALNHTLDLPVSNHQRLLTQWVTYKAFPPQGIYELNKVEVTNLISVAQAVLIQWGYHELALLITSNILPNEVNLAPPTRAVISDPLLDELDKIYPYSKVNKRQQEKANLAYDAIHKLNIELMFKMFSVNPTETIKNHLNLTTTTYSCPVTLVDQMADLIIKVNNSY